MLVNWLPSSNVTLDKLLQLRKDRVPMLVTLLGIDTLIKLLQLKKAYLPMVVTQSGMTTVPHSPRYPANMH